MLGLAHKRLLAETELIFGRTADIPVELLLDETVCVACVLWSTGAFELGVSGLGPEDDATCSRGAQVPAFNVISLVARVEVVHLISKMSNGGNHNRLSSLL